VCGAKNVLRKCPTSTYTVTQQQQQQQQHARKSLFLVNSKNCNSSTVLVSLAVTIRQFKAIAERHTGEKGSLAILRERK
jgi:hypothetical protein